MFNSIYYVFSSRNNERSFRHCWSGMKKENARTSILTRYNYFLPIERRETTTLNHVFVHVSWICTERMETLTHCWRMFKLWRKSRGWKTTSERRKRRHERRASSIKKSSEEKTNATTFQSFSITFTDSRSVRWLKKRTKNERRCSERSKTTEIGTSLLSHVNRTFLLLFPLSYSTSIVKQYKSQCHCIESRNINYIAILYFHRVKRHELQSLNLFLFVSIMPLYDSIFWNYRNLTSNGAGCKRTVASIYRYRTTRMTIKLESSKDSLKEFRTSFKMIKRLYRVTAQLRNEIKRRSLI